MKKITFLVILLLASLQFVVGQCKVENTFFKEGETLVYDMYFKLGFTNTKAGTLKLMVEEGQLKGQGDYKMTFQTVTSGMANSIYPVRDTLYAYTTKDIVPMAYIKNANEGGTYTQEELFYDYKSDGKVDIHTKRHRDGEFKFDENLTSDACIYDMVSVVYYARTLDFGNMKKGDKATINFISGMKMSKVNIEYKGTKRVKGNNGKRYDCFELSLVFVAGSPSEKSKEMMKVFISNDANRIPIEIETNLKKIGAIRGTIKSYEGLRNEL